MMQMPPSYTPPTPLVQPKKKAKKSKAKGKTFRPSPRLAMIFVFFLPPVAVYFAVGGKFSKSTVYNIIFCLLGIVPGVAHAWMVTYVDTERTIDTI